MKLNPPQRPTTRKLGLLFVLVSLIALLPGCASQNFESGTPLSADKIAQIKKGVTTRSEVETLLGPPSNVLMMPEGKRVMSYNYTSTQVDAHATAGAFIPFVGMLTQNSKANAQMRTQTLQVMLTAASVVEDYEFSDNTSHTTSTGAGLGQSNMTTTTQPSEKK